MTGQCEIWSLGAMPLYSVGQLERSSKQQQELGKWLYLIKLCVQIILMAHYKHLEFNIFLYFSK